MLESGEAANWLGATKAVSEWFPAKERGWAVASFDSGSSVKKFRVEQSVMGLWAPFLGADLGNFFGGALSSYWIRRGLPVNRARHGVLLIFRPSILILAAATYTSNCVSLILLYA